MLALVCPQVQVRDARIRYAWPPARAGACKLNRVTVLTACNAYGELWVRRLLQLWVNAEAVLWVSCVRNGTAWPRQRVRFAAVAPASRALSIDRRAPMTNGASAAHAVQLGNFDSLKYLSN